MSNNSEKNNNPFFAVIVGGLFELLFLMFSYWPLVLVAAILAGLCCTELKWGAISGAFSIIIAWSIYLITNPISELAEILGKLVLGLSGLGGIIILGIFLIGALFGFLGGIIGSGIRILIQNIINS